MSRELVFNAKLEDAKLSARMLYVMHAVSFIISLGTMSLVLVFINYLKRPECFGNLVYSHHTWMIRSSWIFIMCLFLSFVLWITVVGIPLALLLGGGAVVWNAYRMIRGLTALNKNRPMPV